MVKLYQRGNLYSVNKIQNSTQVDMDDVSYSGVTITADASGEKYYAVTVAGDLFKLTQDNLNMIVRYSHIENGRIIGKLSWQAYKNKSLFLPVGILDPKSLQYGDIVEPIITYRFDPQKMIYLGLKHIVEYSSALAKRVKKSQHVFVSLDSNLYKRVVTENVINSAYFIVKNDKKMADEMLAELNTNKIVQRHPYHDKYGRLFYVDDYYKTKIVPKLVLMTEAVISSVNIQDARQVVKVDDKFYDVKYVPSRPQAPPGNRPCRGYLIKNMDVLDDPDYVANMNYTTRSSKYMESKEIDFNLPSSYECYVIAYELYQHGKLIGRK